METQNLSALLNRDVVGLLKECARDERVAIGRLLEVLGEFDARKLYFEEGYNSLFAYCIGALHFSEQAACNRIEVARAARRFPVLLAEIANAGLSLTAARVLAPHLTKDNYLQLIAAARHKRTREVELLVAALSQLPAVPSVIRRLPAPRPQTLEVCYSRPESLATTEPSPSSLGETAPLIAETITITSLAPPSRRAVIAPLSEAQYRLQVTLSKAGHDNLKRAQDLMRHTLPTGDAAAIVERALETLVSELLRKKTAAVAHPKPENEPPSVGRHIPASVKRKVWTRDNGQCTFRNADGTQCAETGSLEYHHVTPYARGGRATVDNIEMRCRAHNAHEAELAGLGR